MGTDAERLRELAQRRVEQLRALLARLEREGRTDDPAIRAVRSLLDDVDSRADEAPPS